MSELWENSELKSYYGDSRTMDNGRCEVRIGDKTISLTYYWDDGGSQTYAGPESHPGHFEVKASLGEGKGILHRIKDGRILDGWWAEDGAEGMWRVILHK
jgi:hypothetical protein